MRNIFFDLCAIPIYLIIIWTCISRRLTQGRTNRTFLLMCSLSLACTVLDVAMEYTVNPLPLSAAAAAAGNLISFSYLLLRNATLLVYFFLLFSMTRTEFRLRLPAARIAISLPYAVSAALLIANFWTRNVFSVTLENGYSREPLMTVLYVSAFLYGISGIIYALCCRRFLTSNKLAAILSVYVLTFAAVAIQLFWTDLLVEMFSTSIGLLMILLHVMRPEESMDYSLGVRSWKAYQEDLTNLILTGQHVQIIIFQIINASEIRGYLGDERYDNLLLRGLAAFHRHVPTRPNSRQDVYLERPGIIYVIQENNPVPENTTRTILEKALEESNAFSTCDGLRVQLKSCLIHLPEDLGNVRDILNLGHRFPLLGKDDQQLFLASDLVREKNFNVINHTEDILNRAVEGDSLEIFYQPIFDLRQKRFRCAEALSRLRDSEFGMVPPAVFIPAAERSGMIVALGEKITEAVFRFVHTHDLKALGLDFIEINLSVAQCMDRHLLDTVRGLQERYQINPSCIRFEITETTYDQISDTARGSLNALSAMGYGFALDDYGVGYSNIQRLSRLNVDIIKIDKSMVDELFTTNGKLVIQNTVRMMHDLNKQIVMEGVETEDALRTLTELSSDFIQGFYYSRPLPEKEFIRFLEEARRAGGSPG